MLLQSKLQMNEFLLQFLVLRTQQQDLLASLQLKQWIQGTLDFADHPALAFEPADENAGEDVAASIN